MTDTVIQDFVHRQKRCLQLEFDEEQENPISDKKFDDESPQSILRNLEVVDLSLGLLGRTVLTLQSIIPTSDSSVTAASTNTEENVESSRVKQKQRNLLPCHRLTVGDDVEILNPSKQKKPREKSSSTEAVISGVISAVTDESISIVLYPQNKASAPKYESAAEEIDDIWESSPLTVVPKLSVQIHRKIMQALDDLLAHGTGHDIAGSVIQAAFGETFVPTTLDKGNPTEIVPFNPTIDQSQRSAIEFVLSSQSPITLIRTFLGFPY